MSGKTGDSEHFGLGDVASMVGLTKGNLLEYVKLGAGATAAVTLTDLALSRVLVREGRPLIPVAWSPLAIAVLSVVGGNIVKKKIDADVGLGMIAGGVGLAVSEVIKRFTAPAAVATTTAAAAIEATGAGPQVLAGFGAGRAFAPGLGGFAGLGRLSAGVAGTEQYGIGTPDMSANRMFNGATVAIEDESPLAGAAVQYEDTGMFAGSLS